MATKRGFKVLLAVGLIAALAIPVSPAVAKKDKKKPNTITLLSSAVAHDGEDTFFDVAVSVEAKTGDSKKIVAKYYEEDGAGGWHLLAEQNYTPDDYNDAYFHFTEVSEMTNCKLSFSYPGNKHYKNAKYETGVDCATGQAAQG